MMTSARKLQGALQLSVSRSVSTPSVKAKTDSNTEGGSIGSSDPFSRHEHTRRALKGNSAVAVVLATLALTYLLVTCMLHLSKSLSISSHHVRLLASKFPDEDEDGDTCPAPPGDDEEEAFASSTLEGEAGLAELAGALGAAQLDQMGTPAPADPLVQSRRRLPAVTQALVEKTLRLLRQPAAVVTPILELMRPDQCLSLVRTLCSIAAVELSAFSTVPPPLQPIRQQAAATYVALINQVLSIGATAREVQVIGWRSDMRAMQRLLLRLADIPPENEKLPTQYYSMIMECQQRVSHWMITQVLHVVHNIARSVTPGYTPDPHEANFHQLQVLSALNVARLHQILNSATTRYWLQRHHSKLSVTVVYSPRDLSEAISQNPGSTGNRLNAITNAVFAAGGLPTTKWAPLPLTLEEQQQQLQGDQDSMQQLHQQQQGIPQLHAAEAHGLHATPSIPSSAEQPPVVPQRPYAMPHHHQPPLAQHQTLLPFDPAIQDAEFPTIHPDPQLSSDYVVLEEALAPQIDLPLIYHLADPPVPSGLEPSTSSSATTMPGGLSGDFSAHSHHSGSTDQAQATHPTPQQTPTGGPELSSSEDDDAQ
ncbi:hypothetical protein Emed_003994 [Eimeria media]